VAARADLQTLHALLPSGSGRRRLLRFEGRIENWGPGDLTAGLPRNNPFFEYSSCHNHFHFRDFTDYRLLDAKGNVVAQGHKQSFCLVDMEPVDSPSTPAPPGTRPSSDSEAHIDPLDPVTICNHLSAGWADIYGIDTPCQWVDVTGVAPGDYVLQLTVNPLGRIAELTLENNTVQIPVHVPADVPCAPRSELCGDAVDQDCDDLPDAWDPDCVEATSPEAAPAQQSGSCQHESARH
jgi:Lysyl oxidase